MLYSMHCSKYTVMTIRVILLYCAPKDHDRIMIIINARLLQKYCCTCTLLQDGWLYQKFKIYNYCGTSHARVGGATSLGWHPVDVLTGILDVASLTVDAVLCIDL